MVIFSWWKGKRLNFSVVSLRLCIIIYISYFIWYKPHFYSECSIYMYIYTHWYEMYDYFLSHFCPRYICTQLLKWMSVHLQWKITGNLKAPSPRRSLLSYFFAGNESVQSSLLKPRRAERYFESQALNEWDVKWISCGSAPWRLVTIDKAKWIDAALVHVCFWVAELITES